MIKYTDILKELHVYLSEELDGIEVYLAPTLMWDKEFVGVDLDTQENRETHIGSPNPYEATLTLSIIISAFSPDGVIESLESRDALVGRVFDLLMSNRTIGGLVGATQVGDFKFDTARTEAGFNAAAIIPLRVMLTT